MVNIVRQLLEVRIQSAVYQVPDKGQTSPRKHIPSSKPPRTGQGPRKPRPLSAALRSKSNSAKAARPCRRAKGSSIGGMASGGRLTQRTCGVCTASLRSGGGRRYSTRALTRLAAPSFGQDAFRGAALCAARDTCLRTLQCTDCTG